jgi:hypothetical protein
MITDQHTNATVPLGRFVWHELVASDAAEAAAFYQSVLGWSVLDERSSNHEAPRVQWSDGATTLGGMSPLSRAARAMGVPPHWLPYLSTPDTDATVARAWALGARVLAAPQDVPGLGRVAVLADPQGAVFATFTPGSETRATLPVPPVGRVCWYELIASDQETAFRFYRELFYWRKGEAFARAPHGTYLLFGHDAPVGGKYDQPADIPSPNWLMHIRVADLERTLARVKSHGGRVLNGPTAAPAGDRVALCRDPQGAMFALNARPD